jgi:carbohydrate-selective porin OprB
MRKSGVSNQFVFLFFLLFCNNILRAEIICEVPDVGTLKPNEYDFHLGLTNYWQGAWGGVNTKDADRISGLYDYDLCYLLSAREHEKGLGDYILLVGSGQSSFGHGISESKVGSFFNLNEGVKGDYPFIVDKMFVEFTGWDRLMTFDAGKIDLIDYFDHSAAANEFKDQFFAYPLVQTDNIPFPSKGLGLRARYDPVGLLYVQAGVGDARASSHETGFNTAFDDAPEYFGIGEIGIRPDLLDMEGTYRFMVWFDTQDKSYLDDQERMKQNDTGFALSFDQKFTEKLTCFFRYGWADDKVDEEEDFFSFGGQINEPIEGRTDDVFAVGYARALRSPYNLAYDDERQIDLLETYYKIKINTNVEISPDIQLVTHPGGLKDESPAVVFGVRGRIKF